MDILKLGGSVVTYKDDIKRPNFFHIRRLAKEIAKTDRKDLIIVHGGGSFGHPLAKEYKINEGFTKPSQIVGFCKTHEAMVELNCYIVKSLFEAGVPAIGIPPCSFIITNNKKICIVDLSFTKRLMRAGFTPVLYGDTVLDKSMGFTILSGDQLVVKLAKDLGASKIIFGGDVDGVYTSDPKISNNARLIEHLRLNDIKERVIIGDALSTDVTGGMLGKISESAKAVYEGIKVILINATVPNRVYSALQGEEVIGTIITK